MFRMYFGRCQICGRYIGVQRLQNILRPHGRLSGIRVTKTGKVKEHDLWVMEKDERSVKEVEEVIKHYGLFKGE